MQTPVGEGANLTRTLLSIDGKDKFRNSSMVSNKKNRPKTVFDSWDRIIYGSSIVIGKTPSIVITATLSQVPSP
jgi:hypothetical protein